MQRLDSIPSLELRFYMLCGMGKIFFKLKKKFYKCTLVTFGGRGMKKCLEAGLRNENTLLL